MSTSEGTNDASVQEAAEIFAHVVEPPARLLGDPGAFGAYVRVLRLGRGWSVRGFAKRVGLSAAFVSRMERGELAPPSAETLYLMGTTLGTDPDEMCRRAGKLSPRVREMLRRPSKMLVEFLRVACEESFTDEDYREAVAAALARRNRP